MPCEVSVTKCTIAFGPKSKFLLDNEFPFILYIVHNWLVGFKDVEKRISASNIAWREKLIANNDESSSSLQSIAFQEANPVRSGNEVGVRLLTLAPSQWQKTGDKMSVLQLGHS